MKILSILEPASKEAIKKFSEKMNLKDPEKYGHERSLIAILNS